MKIARVDVVPLSYATDDDPPTRRSFAVVKVTTDEGLIGWGEASDCYGHRHPRTVAALVDEDLRYLLEGHDALAFEPLLARVRERVFSSLGARELVISVLSGIEIALWDLRGKAYGRSVSELLGRCHDALPIYAAGKPAFTVEPAWHVETFAAPLLDRGARAVKIRTGKDLGWDRRFVREVRELLPGHVELFVDGKYNYRPDSAIALAETLGELGVHAFEEPVADVDLDVVRRVADASPLPLAYGEHAFTVGGFRELIVRGRVRVVEPDVTTCGGIGEARKVAALAEAHGVELVPHCGGLTAIGMAANLHFAASLPHAPLFEYDGRSHQPLRDELDPAAPFAIDAIDDGRLPVPSGPGLGVTVDETVFDRYPYEIDEGIARSFPTYATPHI